jgi:GNAT superfamily N-acetyltransferase
VRIRPAAAADIPTLARIATAAYADTFATILEPEALAAREDAFFQPYFAERIAHMRVAEADGPIVGFTLMIADHLDMIFVARAARDRGVGAALLAHAEAEGARSLECFRDNARARAFYESKDWRLARAYEREFIGRARAFVFYEKP